MKTRPTRLLLINIIKITIKYDVKDIHGFNGVRPSDYFCVLFYLACPQASMIRATFFTNRLCSGFLTALPPAPLPLLAPFPESSSSSHHAIGESTEYCLSPSLCLWLWSNLIYFLLNRAHADHIHEQVIEDGCSHSAS